MVIERHLTDKIDMSLFVREAVYNQGVTPFLAGSCRMSDFDDASPHVTWDDTVQTNNDVLTGLEWPTHQEIARQSMTMTYTEPRTKPNTIAGLLGLAMGGIPQATKPGPSAAYRHALTLAGATELPSIAVQVNYDQAQVGTSWRYHGVKVSTITLSNNGAYWQLAATLMGSGKRLSTVNTLPAPLAVIPEHWLRWGDTRLYLRPLTAGTLVLPTVPAQGAPNLSGGTTTGVIDMSCWVRSCSLTVNNNFVADDGYKPCSGLIRHNLQGSRREITVELTFDVESTYEVRALDNYLSQYNMGLEIDCMSTESVQPGTAMTFGFNVIVPAARITRVTRGQQNTLENLTYAATALDDRVNDPLVAWVWNRRPQYLG